MSDFKNPGTNGFDGPSSLTSGETTAPAAITRNPDPVLDRVKRNGSAMQEKPEARPLASSFGCRDRNAEIPVRVPNVLSRK